MIKLLHAGIRKYFKSIVFWVCFALTAVCGIINGYDTRKSMLDSMFMFVQFIIYIIAIVWIAGRENEEGIFRNKIVVGHDKGKIFLSELITGSVACEILFLLHTVIFAVFNSYVFGAISTEAIIKIFAINFIIHLTLGAILVVFATLTHHRAISAILGIAFVFGTLFLSVETDYYLTAPEYQTKWEIVTVTETDENGNTVTHETGIETDEKEKNPHYIEEPFRTILGITYNFLPISHIFDSISVAEPFLGFRYIGSTDISVVPQTFVMTEEINNGLNRNLVCSVILLFGTTAIGYIGFRRKEFK